MGEKFVTIVFEADKEDNESISIQTVKEKFQLSDKEVEIIKTEFNKEQLKALCEANKETDTFLRKKFGYGIFEYIHFNPNCNIEELNEEAQKGGINRMTEKMTLEQFGNVVKFCEQKYSLTPEEVKIVVMEFSEGQLKELSNVSEKAEEYLRIKFKASPLQYFRFNPDATSDELNKAVERMFPGKKTPR